MIARWTIGLIVGTAIIWLSSPLFVRSYLPREINRGVLTLPAGESYRWRSEGYATSAIGRFGIVGQSSTVEVPSGKQSVALWGDSQAEGVCVDDDQKIFALANARAANRLVVIPLARSGDAAKDWLMQIPFVEKELGVSKHLLLITELSDLADAVHPEPPQLPRTNAMVRWLPDFAIHAARNLLTQADGVTPRRLRLKVGVQALAATPEIGQQRDRLKPGLRKLPSPIDWNSVLQSIKQTSSQPIIILYAPQLPRVMANQIVTKDSDYESFSRLQIAANFEQIQVIDLRERLRESAQRNDWPHGFHNGRIGSGHLNVTGNRIVADAICEVLQSENR